MILTSPLLLPKPTRIISLVPSLTELLYYLGMDEEVIAITKFCIHPEHWFKNKIRIGGTKAIDIEKIIALKPDLVICNKEENVKEQVEAISAHSPVWVTDINNLDEALEMIRDIGQLTQTVDKSVELAHSIKNAFNDLHIHVTVPAAYLVWKDPYMAAGGDTFINDMMEKAGLINVFRDKKRYPQVTISQIKNAGCKMVILSSEPYPFSDKNIRELQDELPGIKIILGDGEMFSWYGSRLLAAAGYFKTFLSEGVPV